MNAIVAYQAAERLVATLAPDAADADLRDALDRNPVLLDTAQRAATAAHRGARGLPGAPAWQLDQDWQGFRCETARAASEGGVAGSRTEADWRSRIGQLRIALAALKHFRAIAALPAAMLAEAAAKSDHDRLLANNRAANDAIALRVPPPPTWSAAEFVGVLAQRGVVLSVGRGGALMARPAGLLTEADRAVLAAHKGEIVALLGEAEAVA